jgi:hypothetical protein
MTLAPLMTKPLTRPSRANARGSGSGASVGLKLSGARKGLQGKCGEG